MKRSFLLAAMFALALSSPERSHGEPQLEAKMISERDVRIASARQYMDILSRACRKGWRYSRASIEHGFMRHLEELKAVLAGEGYTIAPDKLAPSLVAITRGLAGDRSGCSGAYWLDEEY